MYLYIPIKFFMTNNFPQRFNPELSEITVHKKIAHVRFKKTGALNYYEFSELKTHCIILYDVVYTFIFN